MKVPSKMAQEAYPIYPGYEGSFGYPSKADIRGEEREAYDRGAVDALRYTADRFSSGKTLTIDGVPVRLSVSAIQALVLIADEWERESNE